jgi:NAD(P)-dependent dehydrogenase (short-subunit alcohol dehydrogenase family)
VVQADVTRPERIRQLFDRVEHEFGTLDIVVSNARPELAAFYQRPMGLPLAQWQTATDSHGATHL